MPDDLQSDIHATAEDIAADAEVLRDIEAEKATIDANDPRATELAAHAVTLAREIAVKTAAEHELVAEANGKSPPNPTELQPGG